MKNKDLLTAVSMVILAITIAFAANLNYTEKVLPARYSAWTKHTGNPGNLSFEEWKHLMNIDKATVFNSYQE